MTGQIAVTPEQLRTISEKMTLGAKEVDAILSKLSDHVIPVRSEWTGPAQAYFNAFWDQSVQDANDLRTVLVGMATLTETAATAYEATDQRIAESFGDFRNSPNTAHANAGDVDKSSAANEPKVIDSVGVQPATVTETGDPENGVVAPLEDRSQSHGILTEGAFCSENATDSESADVETTEVKAGCIEVSDESMGPSKANGGRPWTRFISKSSRSEAGDSLVGAKVTERRFKTSDPALKVGTRLCRLCFTVVSLEPGLIEKTETHDYVRCPHCGNSFPVRRGDMASQELTE